MGVVKAFFLGLAIGFLLRIGMANPSRQSKPRSGNEVRNLWSLKVDVSGDNLSAEFAAASESREE